MRLAPIEVTERSGILLGTAESATQGTVGPKQLDQRPLLRPGEALETVPGVIITQHSGTGKANQLFLRGFNLDHGTDFATSVAGMPVNFPIHGHGQGYTNLNFLIPELISRIDYRKGPYYADEGDFSTAGAAHIEYTEALDKTSPSLPAEVSTTTAGCSRARPRSGAGACKARFKDDDPAGDHIPGAIETVIAAGVVVDDIGGWFGGVRLGYFGSRPLIENDSRRSAPTTLINAGIGYKFDRHWRVGPEVLNLFDAEDSDIEYFYASRLPGEPPQGWKTSISIRSSPSRYGSP